MRKSKKIFWLFLAPCLITFCIAVVIPTITGIYYSFTDWDGLHSNCDFVFLGLTYIVIPDMCNKKAAYVPTKNHKYVWYMLWSYDVLFLGILIYAYFIK